MKYKFLKHFFCIFAYHSLYLCVSFEIIKAKPHFYFMKPIKIFISSVQKEFARERRWLCDYIRQDALLGKFFSPFLFEEMPAADLSAQEAYLTNFSPLLYRNPSAQLKHSEKAR